MRTRGVVQGYRANRSRDSASFSEGPGLAPAGGPVFPRERRLERLCDRQLRDHRGDEPPGNISGRTTAGTLPCTSPETISSAPDRPAVPVPAFRDVGVRWEQQGACQPCNDQIGSKRLCSGGISAVFKAGWKSAFPLCGTSNVDIRRKRRYHCSPNSLRAV